MILRIEDTDAERNKPELVQGIIDGLQWLGVDWDEGPFYQSQRLALYKDAAQKCLANGSAFLCYCAAEKYAGGDHAADGADQRRKSSPHRPLLLPRRQALQSRRKTRRPLPRPRRQNRISPTPSSANANSPTKKSKTSSSSAPAKTAKSGQSTYQMSVVVDDIDMRITHVIRGADHLSNTPKQVLLYRAHEGRAAIFAHLPLILGADKSRLSKRHGATDVNMYRTEGFLPEAFRNFLALLGWAPGGDQEFLRTKELIEKFSL